MTPKCQNDCVEKEQRWRHHLSRIQTVIQSYSNENSMVLVQKHTYGSMEKNSPEVNLHIYGQLIYNKGNKKIQ